MSFILDALKKSESERQRQAGPTVLEARIVRPSRRPPVWAITIGVLLLINFGVVAWLLSRSGVSEQASPAPATFASAPSGASSTARVRSVAPPAPAARLPDSTAATSAAPPAAAPPAMAPATTVATDKTDAVNPADLEPAVAPEAGTASDTGNVGLHRYAELAATLPPLRLDLHVYAANPADRYAFINMHKVREGDVTPEGVRVSQITREGVVLDYRGTEFLLGRE